MSSSTQAPPPVFDVSPIPDKNPLGDGKFVETAGMIVIGDEVLNGKTRDTNSNFFAKHCFDLGIDLKRIEVIADDEDEIIEAARRMSSKYDFVITTGGIGPTHDDITYEALSKAFDTTLERHPETLHRMNSHVKARMGSVFDQQTPEQRAARDRMGTLPKGSEVLFVQKELWVPVVRLGGKLCVFPGIPKLFEQMLIGLTPFIPLPPSTSKPYRHLIFTMIPESNIAPFLTKLAEEVRKEGIRVGSYPTMGRGVTVSLIGKDMKPRLLELGERVVKELDGKVVEVDNE